jgi:hypothetical protein
MASTRNASAVVFPPAGALALLINYSWSRENIQVFRVAGSYTF